MAFLDFFSCGYIFEDPKSLKIFEKSNSMVLSTITDKLFSKAVRTFGYSEL